MNLQEAHDAAVRAKNEELSKAASDARRPYVLAQKANLARIELLIQDFDQAADRYAAGGAEKEALVASGVVQGLRRAVRVLEGRG